MSGFELNALQPVPTATDEAEPEGWECKSHTDVMPHELQFASFSNFCFGVHMQTLTDFTCQS